MVGEDLEMRDIQITPQDILQVANSIHLPNKNLFMHPDIWDRFNKEQQDFLTNNFNKIGFSEALPIDKVYVVDDKTVFDWNYMLRCREWFHINT